MVTAQSSLKEALFLSCREKRCCSYYTVYPTGLDIWRITTALQVPPWSFTTPVPAEGEAPDGFMLDTTRRRHRLALAKRIGAGSAIPPCVFLLHLNDGTARCGLGDRQPSCCRTFPAVLIDGIVRTRNDGGCTCRMWSLSEFDLDNERALLHEERKEQRTYWEMVTRWNSYASAQPPQVGLNYRDFCRYLLDMYTQLDRSHAAAES